MSASLSARMAEVLVELKEFRRDIDVTYARRETMLAWREADRGALNDVVKDVEDLRKRGDADAAWRRQMLLGLGTTILMSLVTLAVALISFLGTR